MRGLAIITPSFEETGETFIRNHIRHLAPDRTVVACFQLEDPDVVQCPVLQVEPGWAGKGVMERMKSVLAFAKHGFSGTLRAREYKRLVQFLQRYGVKKALVEYGPAACAVQPACSRAGVEMYVHYHGFDASSALENWQIRYAYRILAKHVRALICPSHFLAKKLADVGMPWDKVEVVPCGVNVDQFCPGSERDPNVVLAVGRFVEKKAPLKTIQAFERIADHHPQARLEMVGGGPLLERCRHYVRDRGLGDEIKFHGTRGSNFIQDAMGRASFFIQHSVEASDGQTEGLPVSILEAMASGLPVVSTRHAGITEAVKDGQTGFLVDEHDITGMASRISRLLDEPELRRKMGAAARKRAESRFSSDKCLAQLRELLDLKQ